jgi:hypothetical protein
MVEQIECLIDRIARLDRQIFAGVKEKKLPDVWWRSPVSSPWSPWLSEQWFQMPGAFELGENWSLGLV